jgi:hypothetical protein
MKTFNVLIATVGRETLQIMLDSLKQQLKENDHLTIVFDGVKRKNCDVSEFKCKIHIFEEPIALKYWGHGIRNKYANLLEKTDFVMHADDDDRYVPDTFDRLREVCTDTKDTLYIAKMVMGSILPKDGKGILGNVGTPCGIIPYDYNKHGKWGLYGGGDGFFYKDINKIIKNTVWLPNIIYLVRDSTLPSIKI